MQFSSEICYKSYLKKKTHIIIIKIVKFVYVPENKKKNALENIQ